MWWGKVHRSLVKEIFTMGSAVVGQLCLTKFKVRETFCWEALKLPMLPSADKLKENLISFSNKTWYLPILPNIPNIVNDWQTGLTLTSQMIY